MQSSALSSAQQQWVEHAWELLDPDWMGDVLTQLVAIPSPTGQEQPLAERLVALAREVGLNAWVQEIGSGQANAVARVGSEWAGPQLLLFAPLDDAFVPGEDDPWLPPDRPDLRATPIRETDRVIGLSAENPKGYVVAILAALRALQEANVPWSGAVWGGWAGGGMPCDRRPGQARHVGHGVGAAHLLSHGVRPDFAIVAKPGWAVAWEEVGLCWFEVAVHGFLNYTGTRHVLPYRNPIVEAARVVEAIEAWARDYPARHASGSVAPQASIGWIAGGFAHKPAFVPAVCRLRVDVRVSPREDPVQVVRAFANFMEEVRQRFDLELEWSPVLTIPGTYTHPNSWVVKATVQAYEAVTRQRHRPAHGKSGATDANILRLWGIPTARIGMPPLETATPRFSMGVAAISGMVQLSKILIHCAINSCTRSREEIAAGEGAG